MPRLALRRGFALPLGLQQLGLIIGALLVAQIVTLALTVLIPPAPVQRWDLDRVVAGLKGPGIDADLERRRMAGPPDISGNGWLVSESSRLELARRLNRPARDVVLAFYTQLPVGGVSAPFQSPRLQASRDDRSGAVVDRMLNMLVTPAYAQSVGGGGSPVGGIGGPGLAGRAGGFPGGTFPGGKLPSAGGPSRQQSSTSAARASNGRQAPSARGETQNSANAAGGRVAEQLDTPAQSPRDTSGPVIADRAATSGSGAANGTIPYVLLAAPSPEAGAHPVPSRPAVRKELSPASETVASEARTPTALHATGRAVPLSPSRSAKSFGVSVAEHSHELPQPIPFRTASGLLGLTTPPFIEGDFIASARNDDGSWTAVAPRAEPFPNSWQRHVTLWFALSLLIVAPIAWLFTRRIVKPLEGFARAAETLGRDPTASVIALTGPAEIGRAARAFNQMQNRLRAFVDDRTAMVGAISHDLRTPLTRMRFKLEDISDDEREDLLEDVNEMELMISQVIAFIRDASTPGPRERIDLTRLVEGSVASARALGVHIELEANGSIPVEVDPLEIRRLLANLIENAIKYGERARVRVRLQGNGLAVAEIIDDGPGIPEDEREMAFVPFFRCEQARESEKPGSGLGLAVCRSIARAHGGDVQFEQRLEGFVAKLVLPTFSDDVLRRAE